MYEAFPDPQERFDFYELYPEMSRHLIANHVGDYDWMEGDVAIQDGVPVMRHRITSLRCRSA